MSFLKSLAPAVARVSPNEALRAGFGAFLALAILELMVLGFGLDPHAGFFLIAPFGASAVLLFSLPNSPLAQPWSVIMGNCIAATLGVALCLTLADPHLRIALGVGLAIVVTMLARALHPPAGAVAMTAVLSPDTIAELGFLFVLLPVGLGSLLLVALAMVYARLTGRRYPFRQFNDPPPQEPDPSKKLMLSQADLEAILHRYNQSFNLGVKDLARLIGAAEVQMAAQTISPASAEAIMSRDLITIKPTTKASAIAALFRKHRFTSLPVVTEEGRYLGLIFQMDLIEHGQNRLFGRNSLAKEIMRSHGPSAKLNTPIAALLALLADQETDAIAILEGEKILGIVTQSDLLRALAHSALTHSPAHSKIPDYNPPSKN